jgi:spermidine/putrescine transport system ATP-binding protein
MQDVPPYKRPVNTVFQHYALFPHLNVFQHIAFGLERQHVPKPEISQKVSAMLELVQLFGYENRKPDQLSGGQKQRVALGRALVLQPQVLLLDEPLGALDMKLRKEMQVELKHLQERLGITFVFVTHDQEEALSMSNRIAVMSKGKIEQVGRAEEIFEHPSTEFVADFMGATNLFIGQVTEVVGTSVTVLLDEGVKFKILNPFGNSIYVGQNIRFVVRPEKFQLSVRPIEELGVVSLPVTVADSIYQGANTSWIVERATKERVVAIEQNDQIGPFKFQRGSQAFVWWNVEHIVFLDVKHN